jgi:predicted nucleic acid-binding protein
VEWWAGAAAESADIANRYTDLGVSLTDASLVALAARLGTTAIATFDERHFRAMSPLGAGRSFTLLPVDAS